MRSLPQHRPVQGRRPSVGPTTARRRPSTRRRPGAGFLPAWRPAARVIAPRERFRIYTEDEYFAEDGQVAERDGSAWSLDSSEPSGGGAGWGMRCLRFAAGTALVAGAGALGLVVVLNLFASSTHVRRKTALRAVRANARTAGVVSAIAVTRTTHLRPKMINGRARRTRPATVVAKHARPARRSASTQGRSNARSSNAATTRSAAGQALPSADRAGSEPAFPDGRGNGAQSHGRSAEIAASSNSASHRGSGEFGFER